MLKRFAAWAVLTVALFMVAVTFAYAQTDGGGADDASTKAMIFTFAGSAAGVLAGLIFKASPIPNGFIPAFTGVIAAVALTLLVGEPFKKAILGAMAVVGGSVIAYETPKGIKALAGGGGS